MNEKANENLASAAYRMGSLIGVLTAMSCDLPPGARFEGGFVLPAKTEFNDPNQSEFDFMKEVEKNVLEAYPSK